MHARLAGWQSVVMAAAVLSSLVAGVMVARADAEDTPESNASVQRVPTVPTAPARASGRAVDDADEAGGEAAPAGGQADDGSVTVAYTVEEGGDAEIRVTQVDDRQRAVELIDELSAQPRVVAAEVDTVYAAFGAAGRDGPERERQWGLDALRAEQVWSQAHACGATIAVVDSGVDADHTDLVGTVAPGKSVVNRGLGTRDTSGHGTEVAGVAAAAHGNGRGISGLAAGVRILPIAIEDAAGQMHASDLARGLRYAIAQDADVINLSLGGPVQSPNVEYWLQRAVEAGIPIVASAGNAYPNDNPTIWPAASPHTIAVGAVAPTAVWAPFSSTGKYVDLVAPGVAVLTTSGEGSYVAANGTSLSAPFVSATLAMLRVRAPDLTPTELRQVLVSSAKDLGPGGWDPQFGHGMVDPVAALDAVGGERRKCFTDIGALTLADDIERLAFAGITDGCTPGRYCPAQPVTRGQMATFLSRAIDRPPTDADFFTDDEASSHEAGINRLAQAGIARGCTADSFCSNDPVTRAQMAAFISRALDLPSIGIDAFSDDDGDIHEAAINALASVEITSGCDAGQPERFCPGDTVSRAQMAAFLVRMIDSR
jgi:subtilisin family serine protease